MIELGLGIFFRDISNEFFELVKVAEKSGFSHIWIPDELMEVDVYPTLGLCTTMTKGVKLGIAVTNPYTRHPVVTALAMGTLDRISKGRMILGIGAGSKDLLKKLGIEQKSPCTACYEAIEIIRGLWSEGEISYEGEFFEAKKAKIAFPVKRKIPIYLAARGRMMLKTAGRIADGAIIGGMVESDCLDFALSQINLGASISNRRYKDIYKMVWGACSLSKDFKDVRDSVRELVSYVVYTLPEELMKKTSINYKELKMVKDTYSSEGKRQACQYVTDEMIRAFSFSGTPSECVEKIKALEKKGISQAGILLFPNSMNSLKEVLRLLTDEVISQFL